MMPDAAATSSPTVVQRVGLILGAGLFISLMQFSPPRGVSSDGWVVVAMAVLMAVWWFTEALPLGVTALAPLIVLPLAGVSPLGAVSPNYASPFAFLLLGGLMIGTAFEKWNLHTRIALTVVARFKEGPANLAAGIMLAAVLLSMWISNTATCIMLTPIAMSLSDTLYAEGTARTRLKTMLLLCVAYGASIGGIATPIGTPTNLVVIGYLENAAGVEISFTDWMAFGLPVAILLGLAGFFSILFSGRQLPDSQFTRPGEAKGNAGALLQTLGPVTGPEWRLIIIFMLVVLSWFFRRSINDLVIFGAPILKNLSDPHIALIGMVALFAIPSGAPGKRAAPLLDWATAIRIPWGVILLFGGSISLGAAITQTGLADWLSGALAALSVWPLIGVAALIVLIVVFMTEIVGNVATASALVPVVVAVAKAMGAAPVVLAFPLAVAASCAFMLPMATGPNAIVYSTGSVRMRDMIATGFRLNLISIVIVILAFMVL